jgi:potassium efflux system protein
MRAVNLSATLLSPTRLQQQDKMTFMRLRATVVFLALAASMIAAGGTAAQIQLSTPTFSNAQMTGQPAPAKPQAKPDKPAEAAPAAEAPKQAPPDFAIADRVTGTQVAPRLEGWAATLNEIEPVLSGGQVAYGKLRRMREQLDGLRKEIEEFMELLGPKVAEAKAQVDNLGPVPEGGEPEPVAAQRTELQKIHGTLTATRNIAESTKLRAAQLTGTIQDIRRRKFAERLFERVPETLSLDTWTAAPAQFDFALTKVGQMVSAWWEHLDRRGDAIQLLVLALFIASATGFIAVRGVRHFRQWDQPEPPPYWRRSTSAAWVMLLRIMPIAATAAFLYYSFLYQGLMPEDIARLGYSAMRSLLIVTSVFALATTVLAPYRPEWRMLPMDDRAARWIRLLVVALGALYALTLFLDTVRYTINAPFTLSVAQGFISSALIAGLVIAILQTRRNAPVTEDAPDLVWLRRLRYPLWAVAIFILLTATTGYIGLARFMTAQLVVTGTILALLYLLLIWADAVGEGMASEEAGLGKWLKDTAGLDQRRREQLALPVVLSLKGLALIVTLPLILLQWGFDWKDVTQGATSLLFGFELGGARISIAAILVAVIVFALGYFLARFFQGWLDRRVLETAGISGGARHSISTAVGYLGIILAALFAISYTGLDLSNVALVAGALSVGIGLGLQGIVNNFVSGMILLVERPIKVGDWVVVGAEEGIVKKISVRATEIETFDRANVLIPNAAFMSEKVKNWTLHNYSGRIAVTIAANYHGNARQVHDLLLDVAKAHPSVMTNPAPFVYIGDFKGATLDFTLYAFAYDITKAQTLRTELRLQILEAIEKADIETPFRVKAAVVPAPAVAEAPVAEEASPEPQQLLARPRPVRS